VNKITNKIFNNIDEKVDELNQKRQQFNDLKDEIETHIAKAIAEYTNSDGLTIEAMTDSYNEAQNALHSIVEDENLAIDEYISERSDEWHDTEKGEQCTSWREAWGEFEEFLSEEMQQPAAEVTLEDSNPLEDIALPPQNRNEMQ
jgi:hypothetical protein